MWTHLNGLDCLFQPNINICLWDFKLHETVTAEKHHSHSLLRIKKMPTFSTNYCSAGSVSGPRQRREIPWPDRTPGRWVEGKEPGPQTPTGNHFSQLYLLVHCRQPLRQPRCQIPTDRGPVNHKLCRNCKHVDSFDLSLVSLRAGETTGAMRECSGLTHSPEDTGQRAGVKVKQRGRVWRGE